MNREFNQKPQFRRIELPSAVLQVAENSINMLLNQLGNMFTSCDDLFFDLSSRASSNSEQNLYFESMREVRLKKAGIIASFRRELNNNFRELSSATNSNIDSKETELTASALSLIENDQLEQKVAISSMVTKARARCQEEIYHLNCRFDYLISHKQINEKNNPLDPGQICQAFALAAEILELNIKAKIILLKQFDRYIIANLPTLYAQVNQLLINAGVLPKIQSHINKQVSSKRAPSADTLESAETDGINTASVGLVELRNLLNSLRSVGIAVPSIVALVPGYSANAPSLPKGELISLLSEIQAQQSLAAENISDNPDQAASTFNIRDSIKQILLTNQLRGAPKSIQQADEDIINLIAMFFDFVLDDKNLPVQVQALISRLQIPVLKVALKNRAFFNNSQHPARCLINEIASASIGWSEADKHQQDKLLEHLSNIVQVIHDEYVDDEQIFERQLLQLREYLEKETRKANLVEKRASEAAVGQARTSHARSVIQHLLNSRMKDKHIPRIIDNFLNKQWQQVLFLINLREGDQSVDWLAAAQLVDDLIWSSMPHSDEKSQKRLQHLLPSLYKKIESSLQLINTSFAENASALTDIQQLHNKLLNNQLDDIDYPPSASNQQNGNSNTPGKDWQEMTAVEKQQANYRKLEYSHIKTAEKMSIGTWIEFTNVDSSVTRCKLTAKVDVSDSYIFVNRFGSKILEKPRKQFAYELQHKTARMLERGALFDRVVNRIASELKNMPQKPSPVSPSQPTSH